MAVSRFLPDGTRVIGPADRFGKTMKSGRTTQYLPDLMHSGGYLVQWDDDSSETQVPCSKLEYGKVNLVLFDESVKHITAQLGGIIEKYEHYWMHKGVPVESILVISKPAHMKLWEEIHAHVSMDLGVVRFCHVKYGDKHVRTISDDGYIHGQATAEDKLWLRRYHIRRSLLTRKKEYMASTRPLPP